ncbi:MAG: metal-dependent phosphohydrolase, superfamily [Acidobacteria bacterium]|nr:metal-dependent phosphohydrolase, superfamily [Acidobacteriota bacterium]
MLSILIELQRLKNLDRTGWSLRGLAPRTESVAAHSFGVAVTAMALADELIGRGVQLDVAKVLRMALLHDWAEARIGDMPRTATQYFGSETRQRAELAAFKDIVSSSVPAEETYRSLYEEYEQRSSPEARLVKAADVVDLLVQVLALERAGARGLDEFWDVAHYGDFQLEGSARDIVTKLVNELVSARAMVSRQSE